MPALYDTETAEADMRRARDLVGEVMSMWDDDHHDRRTRVVARALAAVRLDERNRSRERDQSCGSTSERTESASTTTDDFHAVYTQRGLSP
jgi:hypothetical protein